MINQEKPFSQSVQETSEQSLQEKPAAFQERFLVLDEEQLKEPSLKETTLPHHQAEQMMALDEETLQKAHGGVELKHIFTATGSTLGCCVGIGIGIAYGVHTGLGAGPGAAIGGAMGGTMGAAAGRAAHWHSENIRRIAEAQPAQPPRPAV